MKTTVHLSLRRLAPLGLAATLVLAIGCSSSLAQVDLYKSGPNKVSLQYRTQDGGAAPQGFAHPGTLTEGQVDRILAAVGVEEYSLFAWRNRGPLFADDERATLAPWIADALRKATADQWVRFSLSGRRKVLVLTTPQLSDGICFVKDGKFNLVLGNIHFEALQSTTEKVEPYTLDPRDRFEFPSVRLAVPAGVGVAPPPVIKGDRWFGRERCNWLVFDLKTFLSPPAEREHPGVDTAPLPAGKPPLLPSGDAAERLKRLKDLRDQGLITAEEYEKKRLEIIQGL